MLKAKDEPVTTTTNAPVLLLADPDQDQAVTLMQLLRLEGYVVHAAASAEQAQQVARTYPLDLALIHERLPGGSGLALCRALHLGRPNLPILLMLRESEEAIGTAFEAGATDYLSVPVSPVVLSRRVARVLAAARARAQVTALEKRWTQSFEKHHAPQLLIDPSTSAVIDANPAACTLYGYTREQFHKLKLKDLEAVDKASEEQTAALSTLFSARHRIANGETRPVKVLSGPVDMDGRTLVLAIVIDQSKRARIEAAARAQRELHSLLEQSAVKLTRSLALNDVLQGLLMETDSYVKADAALLLLVDEDTAYVAAGRGFEAHTTAESLKAFDAPLRSLAPLAWMAEQKRPLLIEDTARYTGWPDLPALKWVGAQVSAPLVFDGTLFGFLLLQNAKAGTFSEHDPERLMAFASPAALALHAAVLYAEVQGAGE
jgi:PAS domain S-box-containing protein